MANNIAADLSNELTQIDTILEVLQEDNEHFEDIDFDDVRERVETRINEAVLSIDKTTLVTVMLGCGGPTRYFEIEMDDRGGIRGKYVNTAFDGYVETDDRRTEIDLSSDEVDLIVRRYGLDAY